MSRGDDIATIIGADSGARVIRQTANALLVRTPDGSISTIYLGPRRLPTYDEHRAMSADERMACNDWLESIGCGDYVEALTDRWLSEIEWVPFGRANLGPTDEAHFRAPREPWPEVSPWDALHDRKATA